MIDRPDDQTRPDGPTGSRDPVDSPAERGEPVQQLRVPGSSWQTVARALTPRPTRAQLLAGLLCGLVGFALVVQLQQNSSEDLASLRPDELVRILDEVTQRSEELELQATELRNQRAELVTGSDTQRAAREAATQRAAVQGILAGRLPAEGRGVVLVIREPDERIPAHALFNVLEELRNAGAEAVQINDLRLTASSYFRDTADGVEVDGSELEAPYRWTAIGDPETISPALNMPGGALAAIRGESGTTDLQTRDLVEVTAVRHIAAPRYATPAPPNDDG